MMTILINLERICSIVKLDLRKILSFSSCLLKESNQKMPLSNRIGIDHLTQKEQEKLNQDFWAYIDLKCKEK